MPTDAGRKRPAKAKPKRLPTEDEALDESLDETFPASDPPAQTDPTRSIKKRPVRH